jgi:hypothetical protein
MSLEGCSRFFVPLLLILAAVFVYEAPILWSPVLDFDDTAVMGPLAHINSISNYIAAVSKGSVLDVQPVRDWIWICQFWVREKLGWYNPQLVSVTLWTSLVLMVFRFLKKEGVAFGAALSFLMLVHPIAVNTVAWPTAQKHLFSVFFVWLATWSWMRALESGNTLRGWLAMGFYALSIFSQPINVLWIIWASVYGIKILPREKRPRLVPLLLGIALSLVCMVVNWLYYTSSIYVAASVGGKLITENGNGIVDRALIMGRYVYQFLVPLRSSIGPYVLDISTGLIGLAGGVAIAFSIFRSRISFKQGHWLLFAGLPLLVVLLPRQQHTGWDTYLLTTLLGAVLALSTSIKVRGVFHNPWYRLVIIISLFGHAWLARNAANSWKSDSALWQAAVTRDPGPMALNGLARVLFKEGSSESGCKIADRLAAEFPKNPNLAYLLPKCIFEAPGLSNDKKLIAFNQLTLQSPWSTYFKAVTFAKQKDFAQALELLRNAFAEDGEAFTKPFAEHITAVAAAWYVICMEASDVTCETDIARIRLAAPPESWSDSAFKEKIKQHRLAPPR